MKNAPIRHQGSDRGSPPVKGKLMVTQRVTLYSIGHSTSMFSTFLEKLQRYDIECLADVRSYPSSRKFPQFGQDRLSAALQANSIDYIHIKELGGRRKCRSGDDRNAGWNNRSFRSYADHTFTEEFEVGISRLLRLGGNHRMAYMCAEGTPWTCHRNLISNVLVARDHNVLHIMGGSLIGHELGMYGATPELTDGTVTYPAPVKRKLQETLF